MSAPTEDSQSKHLQLRSFSFTLYLHDKHTRKASFDTSVARLVRTLSGYNFAVVVDQSKCRIPAVNMHDHKPAGTARPNCSPILQLCCANRFIQTPSTMSVNGNGAHYAASTASSEDNDGAHIGDEVCMECYGVVRTVLSSWSTTTASVPCRATCDSQRCGGSCLCRAATGLKNVTCQALEKS
jgi:hypothetical protein